VLDRSLNDNYESEVAAFQKSMKVMQNLRIMDALQELAKSLNAQIDGMNDSTRKSMRLGVMGMEAPFMLRGSTWQLEYTTEVTHTTRKQIRTDFRNTRIYDQRPGVVKQMKGLDGIVIDPANPSRLPALMPTSLKFTPACSSANCWTSLNRSPHLTANSRCMPSGADQVIW
jgi:hypothetical protein